MNGRFHGLPVLAAIFLMPIDPLLHFRILGHTGCNKDFFISCNPVGRFQGMATFAASAATDDKDNFFHVKSPNNTLKHRI